MLCVGVARNRHIHIKLLTRRAWGGVGKLESFPEARSIFFAVVGSHAPSIKQNLFGDNAAHIQRFLSSDYL